jgi:hypothetical protein
VLTITMKCTTTLDVMLLVSRAWFIGACGYTMAARGCDKLVEARAWGACGLSRPHRLPEQRGEHVEAQACDAAIADEGTIDNVFGTHGASTASSDGH